MITSLDNTLVDGTLLNIPIISPIMQQTNNGISSHAFAVKTVLCDDCGSILINGECKDCSKPILL